MILAQLLVFICSLMQFALNVKSSQLLFANQVKNELACVSNNYTDAIAWITPIENYYTTPQNDESHEFLIIQTNKSGVNVFKSYKDTLGPILDYTWESFPMKMTSGFDKRYQTFNFEFLGEINVFDLFEINLSILAKSQVQIFLCKSNSAWRRAPCLWLILAGWEGTQHALRYCPNRIPKSAKESYICEDLYKENAPNPFSIDKWAHISLTRSENNFSVIHDNKIIVTNQFNNGYSLSELKYLMVHSYDQNAFWKYHDYKYLIMHGLNNIKSTPVQWFRMPYDSCITFFATHSETIKVQLLYSYGVAYTFTFNSDLGSQWNFHKINNINPGDYVLNFIISSTDVLIIRHLTLHKKCIGGEIGFRDSIMLVDNSEQLRKVKCISLQENSPWFIQKVQSIDKQSENLQVYNNNNTDLDSFKYTTVCEKEFCYCYLGYTGDICNSRCSTGSYGFGCTKKCMTCKYDKCSVTSGKCARGCKENFFNEYCSESILPVFNEFAKLEENCINSCNLLLYDKNLQYTGQNTPTSYRVLLKSPEVITSSKLSISSPTYTFENLRKSTQYEFSIILCTEADDCFEKDIKTFAFNTTCKEINGEHFTLNSIDRCVVIEFNNIDSQTNCDINNYYIEIQQKSSVISRNSISNVINNICPINMQYFTNYTLSLYKEGNIISNTTFISDESTPDGVTNITSTPSSNELKITWKDPTKVLGVITHYSITYNWLHKIDCNSGTTGNDITEVSSTRSIVLKNLQLYSMYNVTVTAHSKKGAGVMAGEQFKTLPAKDPTSTSFNTKLDVKATALIINFLLDCDNWDSPITILAIMQCKSTWCSDQQTNQTSKISSELPSITFNNLLAFTQYNLKIYYNAAENFDESSGKLYREDEITTLPMKPNRVSFLDVYAISQNAVFVRWNAPYPPTGNLELFEIEWHYINYWGQKYTKKMEYNTSAVSCNIWKESYCTMLQTVYEKSYNIIVTAKNKGISGRSQPKETSVSVQISEPEPPLNVQDTWTKDNELVLHWTHPNRTNGPKATFQIKTDKDTMKYSPDPQLDYEYNTFIKCTLTNHDLNIAIATHNTYYVSSAIKKTFTCPTFTPELKAEAKISAMTNDSITLFIPGVYNAESNCMLKIIALNKQYGDNCDDLNIVDPMNDTTKLTCLEIEKYPCKQKANIENTYCLKNTSMLNFNTDDYAIYITLINNFKGNNSIKSYNLGQHISFQPPVKESSSTWWIVLIICILLIIIIAGILVYKYNNWFIKKLFRPVESELQPDLIPLTKPVIAVPVLPTIQLKPSLRTQEHKEEKYSRKIQVNELENYLKEAMINGELEKQHEQFPRGIQMPIKCGEHPINNVKNRYKNLVAYDHTRVVLDPLPGIENSDYINANFINSPWCKNAFIATQGPKDNTLFDFWRMIIQYGVEHIIMLANVKENGKPKVEKYWPDFHKFKRSITYEDITVTATEIQTFSNYELRYFTIERNGIQQTLTQHHFTAWPDHGVPTYTNSLMPFMKCILDIQHDSEHPILVHCSAGVGRTGTIILADICIRMGKREQYFDVYHQLYLLRKQRPNLVDNIQQYKLVHMILLEYFSSPNTNYNCDDFETRLENLTDKIYAEQLQYIETSAWQEDVFNPPVKIEIKCYPAKDRNPAIVPTPSGCIYLRPRHENDSTYINAVYVDGFHERKKFIVTQHPLANTVDDFWRLIDENDIQLIISLQGNYDVPFWKREDDFKTGVNLDISHISTEEYNGYEIHKIELQHKEEPKELHLFELNSWKLDANIPEDLNGLLDIWRRMDKYNWKDNSILVLCRDGATACGLFIAMSFLLERIKEEQSCDVCQCVRSIRRNRKQFITDIVQFKCLHRLAALYLSEFDVYSNFKTI